MYLVVEDVDEIERVDGGRNDLHPNLFELLPHFDELLLIQPYVKQLFDLFPLFRGYHLVWIVNLFLYYLLLLTVFIAHKHFLLLFLEKLLILGF